jgi:hypothetical protein
MKKADILKIPAKNTQRKTSLLSQANWKNLGLNTYQEFIKYYSTFTSKQ